jgi:hypothetical protein
MRMLRRRAGASEPVADGTTTRPWHGPTRALLTLLAVGAAGLLAWLTTNISDKSTGGYWAVYGIFAGAGLVMALSQLLGGWTKWGRPRLSAPVLLLAFVPTLIAVGWMLLFHQPPGALFRGHIVSWSRDLGIDGFVKDVGSHLAVLSFGLGLVFGFSFDTTGARRPVPVTSEPAAEAVPADTDADQPLARERDVVRS